jgi:outer membrane protein assembly complex protein YaeT
MRLKFKKKKVIIVLTSLLLLIIVAFILLNTRFMKSKILQYVSGYIERTKKIQLSAQSLGYNLLKFRFTLKEVVLHDISQSSLPPFFQADEVKIRIPLGLFFGKRLQIRELDILNPKINIYIAQNGTNNLPFPASPKKPSKAQTRIPEFVFNQSSIKNARIHFTDQMRNVEWKLSSVWLSIKWLGESKHSLFLEMRERGYVANNRVRYYVDGLITKAELDHKGIDFEELRLNLAQSEFKLSGRVDYFSSPYINLNLLGKLDLIDIVSGMSINKDLSGKLDLRAHLQGYLKTITARIQLKGKNLHFERYQNINLMTDAYWKDKLLSIDSMNVKMPEGEIQARGELHPLHWKEGNRIDLKWKSINIESSDFFSFQSYNFASRTSGSFRAYWRGLSLESFKGQANVQLSLEDQKIGTPEQIPLSGDIQVDFNSGKITVSAKNLSIPEAVLNGKFHADPKRLSGRFRLEAQDLKKLSSLFFGSFPDRNKEYIDKLGINGQIRISGILGGSLKSPSIEAEIESKNISIHNFREIKLEGKAIYDSETIRVEPLHIQEGHGTIEITGFYPVKAEPRSMRFKIAGKRLSLERILKAFGQNIPAKAQMELDALIEGRLDDLIVQSSLVFAGSSLYNQKFERVEITGNYRNKEIVLNSLKAVKSKGRIESSGRYNIEKGSYSARVSIDSLMLQDFQLPRSANKVSAVVHFHLEGRGTLRSPRFVAKGRLKGITFNTQEMGDLRIQAGSSGEELEFRIVAPLYSSALEGNLRLAYPYPLTSTFRVNNFSLEKIKSWALFEKTQEFSGNLKARVNTNLNLGHPRESVNIQAHVEELRLKTQKHQVRNEGPISIFFDSKAFQVESLNLVGSDTEIHAEGILPVETLSPEGLRLTAKIDLALLTSFNKDIRAEGFLDIDSHVSGSILSPVLNATLDLSNARSQFTKIPLLIEDFGFRLRIAENMMSIESFSFLLADGSYRLEGDIPLESLPLKLFGAIHDTEKRSAEIGFIFHSFNPSSLKFFLPEGIFQETSGKIDGKIEITGESFSLNELSGKAKFDRFELEILSVPFRQENPIEIILKDGKILPQNLAFSGEENRMAVSGEIGLTGEKTLNVLIESGIELKVFSAFLKDTVFSGRSILEVKIAERLRSPVFHGFVEFQNAGLKRLYPNIFLSRVNGKVKFDQNRLIFDNLHGDINGGKVIIDGDIKLSKWSVTEAAVNLHADNMLFDFPAGLRSQVFSRIRLESDGKKHVLNGGVEIVSAKYSENFSVESALYQYLRRGAVTGGIRKPNEFLNNLNLNITIVTLNNLLIDNNISKSEVNADLKLTGTFYNPALSGRAVLEESGEIYFGRNTFLIEQGTVDFINPYRIEPDLNINARTRVGEYDIRLTLAGTPDKFSANLASDPPISEPNIISLLVTGRTLESASASIVNAAGNKALSYINNAFTGRLEQSAMKILGLESVKVDASLVSTEENPGARITVGQHIRSDVELVFSQDLKDAQNRTWILNYNPIRDINLQGVKRDNNEYSFALRHELRFGLNEKRLQMPGDLALKKELIIGEVAFKGNLGFPEKKMRSLMRLGKGKRFDFYKLQEKLDRIYKFYLKNNFLSYTLDTKREEENGKVNITFNIEAGPKIFFKYQGAGIPRKFKKYVKNIWTGGYFGQRVVDEIKNRLHLHFVEKKYYQVAIQTEELTGREDEKVIHFRIAKGIKYQKPDIYYSGNQFLSREKLNKFLNKGDWVKYLFLNPQTVTKNLESLYARDGFLRARVHSSRITFDPIMEKVKINIMVEEGPQFKVRKINLSGNQFFDESKIINEVRIKEGDAFSEIRFREANLKIKEIYSLKGFNQANVQSSVRVHEEENFVDLNFNINENRQAVVSQILISGNILTKDKIIRREIIFKKGDVVNFQAINETRKRLYDLGIFERVNINAVPLDQATDASYQKEDNPSGLESPYRVDVHVKELKPYRLRYGFQFDTETLFGLTGQLINRNLFGRSHLLGTSFRLNRDERDLKVFFRSHYFFAKKRNTELFTFVNRSIKPEFTVDRMGFTFQQNVEFKRSYIFSYNYTFERSHTFQNESGAPFGLKPTLHLGILNVALTRDTRENMLNASRGTFLSQSVEYAPRFLGSDVEFVRYFGQFFLYKNLAPFLTWASGVRIGLGKGLGEELVPSERFFAGGGTTIRGFGKNEIGPKDPNTGLSQGGDAVFILNQELRFPLYKRLSGAVFLDIGNVYSKASDFNPFSVRKSAGFGLRFNTPFALVRFDWGFKLDRRPGESLSAIFFSIGQAF